ncbi:L-ribulose-5-phosphate 3-epimerase [Amycolatopsis balhimycina DSM 5908]|uniref:L-ribulose-5-phosphate 3-epimerase n=1 Tax=Amycolatopsis balhimycina DSM 5908 TaxID=1081091 RepID=A0A428WB94_AMYBA|nr:L-ribulose-5-phosphate 3-epimerase [Amycolatopsis balhimycina]RSM40366.1 L-ribulose-5-phosphate 3-epimerase [Amycolatopsis balhimycina DSM 5908]
MESDPKMRTALADRPFGIYEKALAPGPWLGMLEQARDAGFQFVEMSLDESADRLARLAWSAETRRRLVADIQETGIPIYSICLSAHRRFGLGSADPQVRTEAARILHDAVDLAADLGVRVIQIAGYFAYYEPESPDARSRYVDGLRVGLAHAAERGVMLAVENIDTVDMASVSDCLTLRDELDNPWFQIYPDIGNLAVHSLGVAAQTALVKGAAVGLHLKDARAGEPRRVPFGEGTVPFPAVFQTLNQIRYDGPLTLEMWNDDPTTATQIATDALRWIRQTISDALASAS